MDGGITLAEKYSDVVDALEETETELRLKAYPSLLQRASYSRWKDSTERASVSISKDGLSASLERWELRTFSLDLLSPQQQTLALLTSLDVRNNKLLDLPGLEALANLVELNISQNYFKKLPSEIGTLAELATIDASRNSLAAKHASLRFAALQGLPLLRNLDLRKNKFCGRHDHVDFIQTQVPQLVTVQITLWTDCSVGSTSGDRDSNLLRSRLEPLGTGFLRQRMVQDFGQTPTNPLLTDRASTMKAILSCYEKEGMTTGDMGGDGRHVLQVDGTLISDDIRKDLLVELRDWRGNLDRGGSPSNRERPSIHAQSYMILNSPDFRPTSTKRAIATAGKLSRNRNLWDLAMKAVRTVDPGFADRCTELAVTFGFQGSPHIDRQNTGPFYGLALGNYPVGQGGLCVECSARVLAVMNTRNRLGKVDGRHVHWVEPYDSNSERFSLIYYVTGGDYVKPGPAIFSMPDRHIETGEER